MVKRRTSKTNHQQIIEYWSSRVNETDLNIDFSGAHERCWRCGCESKLERCHIIPHSLGGEDEPNNYVLLCIRCHKENPNVSDPNIMWDWLKAHREDIDGIYWTLRGMKEYEFIYGKSFHEELQVIELEMGLPDLDAESLLKSKLKQATRHFGQSRMNPATLAGVLRMTIHELKSIGDN